MNYDELWDYDNYDKGSFVGLTNRNVIILVWKVLNQDFFPQLILFITLVQIGISPFSLLSSDQHCLNIVSTPSMFIYTEESDGIVMFFLSVMVR